MQAPSHFNPTPPRIGTITIPTDPYWIQVLEAMIHASQKNGDELVVLQLATSNDELALISHDELMDHVLAQDLDALILAAECPPILRGLLENNLPVICLYEIPLRHPFLTVTASLYQGGKIAGNHIGRRLNGKGRALCVTAGQEVVANTGQSRLSGFCDGLRPYPAISIDHVPAFWRYDRAYPTLLEKLENYPCHVDAIFGVSDTLILAARDAGRKVGMIDDQTILVGLNGDPLALAAIADGSLDATVDTAGEDLGKAAANLAHQAARGMSMQPVIDYHFQLITRENVASVATRKLTAIADIPSHMVGYNRQQERERLSQLEISIEITRQIGSLRERDRVAQIVGNAVREHYGYDWVRILRWLDKEQRLVLFGGDTSPASERVPIERDALLEHVCGTGQVVFIPDTQTSRHWHLGKEFEAIRSRIVLPIQLGGKVIGVLDLQSARPIRQPSLELVGLELLATQLGIVFQNEDLYVDALQAREVAEKANQLRTRLIANVGHEMRTPLSTMLGVSQAVQAQINANAAIPPEALAQDLGQISKSGEHLMYMINDLLDLSRAEIGALSLYLELLEPTSMLQQVFQDVSRAEENFPRVQWKLDIPERLPLIRVDAVRLRQILTNLLVNSRKFTRAGSITLGVAVEPPNLHIWVADTGQGIPIEFQGRIFEPFETTGRKRRPEGIGLGLSITRHLVALHGGTITLESQPNVGTMFSIYLPLPGVSQEPNRSLATDNQNLMLVVSSGSVVPQEIQLICERQEFVAVPISRHADLDAALARGRPCAIAWDLVNASPIEWMLVHRVSSNPECAALPFLLFNAPRNENQGQSGLTQIVYKPFPGNTLQEWINQIGADVTSTRSILVVDDDPECRSYYCQVLKSSHPENRVLVACDGTHALEILEHETPALVLLDLMMPHVDGFQVLERIRTNPQTRSVPVLIISGKLLNYEDVQRLNHSKTHVATKGTLSEQETSDFVRQLLEKPDLVPQPTSLLVKQAVAFVHQNFTQPITRKEIAAAVGVNQNYLSQIFRQEMNISPLDYLSRLRVSNAKILLRESHETITHIAARVGFNDAAYFSRVFHKFSGQSPQEYRRAQT